MTSKPAKAEGLDIVSFAFGTYGKYDIETPIFLDAADESKCITASAAFKLVKQLVAGLQSHGLIKGDCICLHAVNNVLYPPLWLGIVGAGGVVSGANPANTLPELVHHLTITKTKFVIAQEDNLEHISKAAKVVGIQHDNIFLLNSTTSRQQCYTNGPQPYQLWTALLGFGEQEWNRIENQDELQSTLAALGSTSGTTGLPKAAKISHHALVTQSKMIQSRKDDSPHQIVQLACLPVFHGFAAALCLILPLRGGTSTYFVPRYRLPDFINVVERFHITDVAIVPPIVTSLLHLNDEEMSKLRSLRYVLCAGAPIHPEIQDKLYRAIHPKGVVAQVWGTTETGWVTAFGPTEKDSSGSVGRPLPDVEIKIVNSEGDHVADGVRGEACVRTPSMYSGYLGMDAKAEADVDGDGYYHTGDRAFRLGNRVFIDGRIKDTLKVNGWQVSPSELENILLQHPDIIDVAVIGKEKTNVDGLREICPQAFVVRRHLTGEDHPSIVEEDVKAFVAARVVSYKRLTGGVVFVEKIPRNSTGKILRRLLENISKDDPVLIEEPLTKTDA